MRTTVVPASELDLDHIKQWRSIQLGNSTLSSPYFCPEFTQLTASARNDVYVGIIEENEKIIGFFPHQKHSNKRAGPVSGPLSDYHGLIIESDRRIEIKDLMKQCGLVEWAFNHLLASQSEFADFHENLDISYVIDLSEGVDQYMQIQSSSGSNLFSTIARKRRKLEREIGPIRFESEVTSAVVLQKVLEWKSQQYLGADITDIFSYPWTRELVTSIHKTQSQNFAGVLSALYAGNELIAGHIGMRSHQVWHWWFPSYSRGFSKYSPGSILLFEMIQNTRNGTMKSIDLGKDWDRYKEQFSNTSVKLAEGSVTLFTRSKRLAQFGNNIANFIRRTPLVVPARIPSKLLRRYRAWKRFS